MGSASHFLGLLARTMERWDDAIEHLTAAVSMNESMSSPPWATRSRYDLARALLGSHHPSAEIRALRLLAEVIQTATALGMHGLVRRAKAINSLLSASPTEVKFPSLPIVGASSWKSSVKGEKRMLDLAAVRQAILRDWDVVVERLESASNNDWNRPVRCVGWKVRDLAAHIAWGQSMEANALYLMRHGSSDPPSGWKPDADSDTSIILDAIKSSKDKLYHELQALTPELLDGLCPLPYGSYPAAFALQIFTMEAGVHRNDLIWALGDKEPLSADVINATTTVLSVALPFLAQAATEQPAEGTSYKLLGSSVMIDIAYKESAWQIGIGDREATCKISGDDSTVILFALGRIPANYQSLTITGDRALAEKFKTYFPGP
jgi:uncharacterized protein (TIGR03083 family)